MVRVRPLRSRFARAALAILSLAVALAASGCAGRGVGAAPERDVVAITGVAIVDPESDSLRRDMTVVVRGGHIAGVHPARSWRAPRSATVVDGTGRYLMPGLWDAHVHVGTSHDSTQGIIERARDVHFPQFLLHGVTSVRDMAADRDSIRVLQAAVEEGRFMGPRIYAASRLLGGRNPWAPGSPHVLLVTDADSAAAAVAELVRDGALFVKVHDMLSREAYFAAARAARAAGLPLVGHLRPSVTVDEAIAAGQVGIEHLPIEVVAACAPGDPLAAANTWYQRWIAGGWPAYIDEMAALWARRDAATCRGVLGRLREAGVHVTPTLALRLQDSVFLARTGAPLVRTSGSAATCATTAAAMAELPDSLHQRHERTVLAITAALHDAGVEMMAGSDGPQGCLTAGAALHEELRLLVAAGLSPREALRAATTVPARFLGAADSVGTIAAGKVADLVLLDANPLDDIANARRIAGVMSRGRWMTREALLDACAGVAREHTADRLRGCDR